MTDNTAVAQTNIYKNGKLYDYIVPAVKVGGNKTQNVWTDYDFADDNATYEAECIDVCGNVSDKCSFTFDWNELKEKGSLSITTKGAIDWNLTSLDYLSYMVTDSGIRINGCDKNAVNIIIPDEIEGKPVTVIDWYGKAEIRCHSRYCNAHQSFCLCTLHFIGNGKYAEVPLFH